MSFTTTSCISGLLLLFLALTCEARVPKNANVGFIAVNGAHFELNGSSFLFNGFNSYWLMHVAAEPSERYKVTEVLKDASAAGLSVCRTWAFSDGGDRALQISPGVYDERVFQKVITRFNTITKVAYRDDPTIMAWELINEPRNQADYSGKTINAWVQEMASFVKSLDKKHLLEVGMEGFYGDSVPERKQVNPGYQVGTDFISNHLINEIDFATIHAYTDQWVSGQSDEAQLAWMQRWVTSHWEDAKTILKKPLVLSEFGKSSRDQGYNLNSRDTFMGSVYRNIYNLAKEGGSMAGSLVWQLMAHGMENYDDGYCIVLGQNPSTTGIISGQSHAMTTLANRIE
uniref:mannan endo-1,4-beta-mannosidase n=1 Tax=Nicotiana sylvestris TaxID=4096 RepID=A0A1U7XBK4_NICSY|nr:PREDICTED: mannan endo-1,4-beta-mannosidase 1-like isoform X2 [Nicotiana sylvestris]